MPHGPPVTKPITGQMYIIDCLNATNATNNGTRCPPDDGPWPEENIPMDILEITVVVLTFLAPVLVCWAVVRCYEVRSMHRARTAAAVYQDDRYVRQSFIERDSGVTQPITIN